MSKTKVKQFSGKKFGIIRKKKGCTQQHLADAVGVTRPRISHYEMGTCPPLNHALVFADELGCDIYDFCQ